MRYLILLTLLLVACLSESQTKIYKTVHKDGTVTYSDQATEGSVEVNLNANTTTMQSIPVSNIKQNTTQQKPIEYQLDILDPAPDATIRNNLGEFTISAALTPQASGYYQLQINGTSYRSATGLFQLTQMDRGTYTYSVNFVSQTGKIIASTPTRELHLHKASVLINRNP